MRFWSAKIYFCNTKQISRLLRAVWAENVFDQIIQTTNKNLLDHLLNYRLSQNKIKVFSDQIEESRVQFMKKFDPFSGIMLPNSLINIQRRLTQAANKQNKLTFYPNTLTTPDIFRIQQLVMDHGVQCKYMTIGQQGISKTMSYILSWVLSSESVEFRYHNQQKTNFLVAQKILRKNMHKILYLSFKETFPSFYIYTNFILDQCPQVKDQLQTLVEIRQNMSDVDFRKFLVQLNILYGKRGTTCFFVLDQINSLANIFKKSNQFLQNNTAGTRRGFLDDTETLFNVYKHIYTKFSKIFNSSSHIQIQLLQSETDQNFYTLDINQHTPTLLHYFHFNQKGFYKIKVKEIYRHIWYQASKLIPHKHSKFQQIRQRFLKQCDLLAQNEGFKSYVTPLSIYQSFSAIKAQFSNFYQEKQGRHKQRQFVQSIYQKIENKGKQIQIKKLNKFFQKPDPQSIKILLESWFYLRSNDSQISVPVKQLSTSYQNILSGLNKDLFIFVDGLVETIQLIVSRKEFFQLFDKIFQKIIANPQLLYLVDDIAEREDIYGVFIEMAIIKMMKSYNKFLFLVKGDCYFANDAMNFKHFLGKGSIFKSLEKILEQIANRQIGLFCFPDKLSKQDKMALFEDQLIQKKQLHSTNNPSIDMIYIRQNRGDIQITSFDLTTINEYTKLKNKIERAQKLLKNKLNFPIIMKKQLPNQNKFVQSLYDNIRLQKKLRKDLEQKNAKNQQQKLLKIENYKKNRKNLINQFCDNILTQTSSKIKIAQLKLIENPDQLLQQIVQIFIKENWGIKNDGLITKWEHMIICRQEFLKRKIKIPQKEKINGTDVSFILNSINQIKITRINESNQQSYQTAPGYRYLLNRLLKKLQGDTNEIEEPQK